MTGAVRLVLWLGGMALLSATAIDTAAVVGRHLGMPMPGSIELMQAAVLVSGVIAILVATIENAHARVKLVVDRLSQRQRVLADRLSDMLTFLFFAAMLAGSSWIAWDLRHAHEQSELIGVPWAALRVIAGLFLFTTCCVLARRIVTGGRSAAGEGDDKNSAVSGE